MEEKRDPVASAPASDVHPGAAVPPAPPVDWSVQHGAYTASAAPQAVEQPVAPSAPRVGRAGMGLRLARLLVLRAIGGFLRVGQALRPHVGWLAVLGVFAGIIVVQAFLLVAPRLLRSASGDVRVALLTPPAAVTSFLEGQSTYNADLMWEAFSPEFQANLIQLGASRESIAAQVEDERLAGRRYGDVAYIGGIQLGDRSRYYYVVDIDSPQPDQAGSFSFIFTVNRDGKIVGVQRE